jgi:nitric oxide reductase activation protein
LLSDIGVGSSAIFYKTKTDKYGKLNLHISVDASGSMKVGDKWDKTMTLIVAICKAASMVNNLRVIVSFRSTISVKSTVRVSNLIPPNSMLPYVVIAYDSNVDKFSKVTSFFSKLCPGGYTPEGLTFDAIQNTLPAISANEQNHLLIISDGIPCFEHKNEKTGHHTTYDKSSGAIHTKRQYELLKRNGVKGIAYFIKTPPNAATSIKLPGTYDNSDAVSTFKLMYGADARFIEVDDVLQISNTLNALFLDSVDKND